MTRFVFYEDPPGSPHIDDLETTRTVTNNVFTLQFDPCLSQQQATVIRPEDLADPSQPIVVLFTPRHGVPHAQRRATPPGGALVGARVAKDSTQYWNLYTTCSDFNRERRIRAGYCSQSEAGVQADSNEISAATMSISASKSTVGIQTHAGLLSDPIPTQEAGAEATLSQLNDDSNTFARPSPPCEHFFGPHSVGEASSPRPSAATPYSEDGDVSNNDSSGSDVDASPGSQTQFLQRAIAIQALIGSMFDDAEPTQEEMSYDVHDASAAADDASSVRKRRRLSR